METEIESTFIEIKVKNGKHTVVGSMYRPLNSKENKFTQELTEIINKVKSEHRELIHGMDHNLDLLKSSEHSMTQKFIDNLLDNDMLPAITRPTRITHSTATLIDNVFVSNQLYRDFKLAITLNDMSDHMPLLTLLKQTKFMNKANLEFKS